MSDVLSSQQQTPGMGSTLYAHENSGPVELLPNPNFVFPARSAEEGPDLTGWTSLTQRRRSDHMIQSGHVQQPVRTRQTASLLPNFTFNPAGSGPSSPTTPPHSPSFNGPTTPSRMGRHRRGGSEFVGMDHKTGNVTIVNASPVKPDSSQTQPPLQLGPPPGRRHAHRRSGAISCHDLSSILQPKDTNIQTKSESAPTSPLDLENRPVFCFPPELNLASSAVNQDEPKNADQSPQKRPPSRARVGFSERVEYIRPLSIISSETESSMSTIRGHSVSGSFSSMMSSDITCSSPHRPVRMALQPPAEDRDQETDDRPQTAVEFPSRPLVNSSLTPNSFIDRPRTSSCVLDPFAEAKPKKKAFSWWDSKSSRTSTVDSVIDSITTSDTTLSLSPPVSPTFSRRSLENDQDTIRISQADGTRKPRKVRSWAHSLISRKPKTKKDHPRPPTPPVSRDSDSEVDDNTSTSSQIQVDQAGFEVNFDDDNTVTIISEASRRQPSPPIDLPQLITSLRRTDSDILSPVIDLDAALGPFNTPPLVSNARDLSGRQPPRPRRSMHSLTSAAISNGFGPTHRRTESAPELVPFELRPNFVPHVMPDVFEEEGEEDLDDSASESRSTTDEMVETEATGGIHIVELDDSITQGEQLPPTPGFGPSRRKKSEGLVISTDSTPRQSSYHSPRAFRGSFHRRQRSSVEVVQDHEEPRDSKSSEDTVTPPHSGGKEVDITTTLQFPLPLRPQNIMTPDTLSDVSSSPFFSPSQASLEVPRIGTGTSSINESLLLSAGEPGPEIRMSVDDVPSLTSSRSTMASPIVMPCAMVATTRPLSSGRAPSLFSIQSSATIEIRAKRSSIASISRFVTGNFGAEKSKLSIESRPMSHHANLEPQGKTEKRRSHRLSKLMQFWRSREQKEVKGN
jgi:hypothetical protein